MNAHLLTVQQAALFKEAQEKTEAAEKDGKPEQRWVVAMDWWEKFKGYISPDDGACFSPPSSLHSFLLRITGAVERRHAHPRAAFEHQ